MTCIPSNAVSVLLYDGTQQPLLRNRSYSVFLSIESTLWSLRQFARAQHKNSEL